MTKDWLTYIDPLPPAHGQRAADERRLAAKMRAATAWDKHLMGIDVNEQALQSVRMEAREARLRPTYREDFHLVRGRMVPVMIRREYPYGPAVISTGQKVASLWSRIRAAILTMTLQVVSRVYQKEHSWLEEVTKPRAAYGREMRRGNLNTRRPQFMRRGGQRGT